MKDNDTVIQEFSELVNMTHQELEQWLKSDDSRSAGWPKEGADGESVGHDSGRNIVDILKSNPDASPDKYTEEHLQHMRKVVSYCKRHLAQEEKSHDEKSPEEVKKTKSYASLKNWGHDVLKERGGQTKSGGDEGEGEGEDNKQAGSKRKAPAGGEGGDDDDATANKKRETEQGKSGDAGKAGSKKKSNGNGTDHKESNGNGAAHKEGNGNGAAHKEGNGNGAAQSESNGKGAVHKESKGTKGSSSKESGNGAKAQDKKAGDGNNGPAVGDTVSWDWGNGQPEGKVLDVKEEKTTITTKRGNEVSRDGNPEDPAVVLDAGKSKAIKSAHELNN